MEETLSEVRYRIRTTRNEISSTKTNISNTRDKIKEKNAYIKNKKKRIEDISAAISEFYKADNYATTYNEKLSKITVNLNEGIIASGNHDYKLKYITEKDSYSDSKLRGAVAELQNEKGIVNNQISKTQGEIKSLNYTLNSLDKRVDTLNYRLNELKRKERELLWN